MTRLDYRALYERGPLPDPSLVSSTAIIEDLWPTYVDTVGSHLISLEAAAMSLEAGRTIAADAASIRRLLHSIKGDSGMSGVTDVYELCHEAECAFGELADHRSQADMVLRVKDWIEAAIQHIQSGESGMPAVSGELAAPRKIRTLVVDDDRVCRKRIQMLLEEFCECAAARDGRKGYEMFEQALEQNRPYRLVTLDIQMPKMDGHETLLAIRRLEERHGIRGLDGAKIIMTTSHDTPSHVFAAFREGCEAYVIKRDMADKLLEEMANLGLLKVRPDYSIR